MNRGEVEIYTEMTLQEIADKLGISKQAVHKTERRALRKLRERCREYGLAPEDLRAFEERHG